MSYQTIILSTEQARDMASVEGQVSTICNHTTDEFAFVSKHGVPMSLRSDPNWIPVTTSIPLRVTPRESLPTGIIETVDDYLRVFHRNEKQILPDEVPDGNFN